MSSSRIQDRSSYIKIVIRAISEHAKTHKEKEILENVKKAYARPDAIVLKNTLSQIRESSDVSDDFRRAVTKIVYDQCFECEMGFVPALLSSFVAGSLVAGSYDSAICWFLLGLAIQGSFEYLKRNEGFLESSKVAPSYTPHLSELNPFENAKRLVSNTSNYVYSRYLLFKNMSNPSIHDAEPAVLGLRFN